MAKTLLVTATIFFAVVCGELIFLFFYSQNVRLKQLAVAPTSQVISRDCLLPKPIPNITPLINRKTLTTYYSDILPNLANQKYNSFQNYYFVSEEKGVITKVEQNANDTIVLFLTNGNGENPHTYTFTHEKFTKIILSRIGGKSSITVADLKAKSNILMRWKESLVNSKDHQIEIVLLN